MRSKPNVANSGAGSSGGAVSIAVIDGPYDDAALSRIVARPPVNLGNGRCGATPNSACNHGTFILGLLAARRDTVIPGLCPDCRLLHAPLFIDDGSQSASVEELAKVIRIAVAAGARLINLSLAIVGDDSQYHPELAAALDYAEASGAVVVVAAGNQGRLAMGQLLSHPVTIPVVAVDAAGRLLPDCNFGPAILRRGVAAPGKRLGYAPGGGTVLMSGTSVAAAVATGILGEVWSARPDVDGARIRAAVAGLASHDGSMPPMLDRDVLSAALDRTDAIALAAPSIASSGKIDCASLQGETTMTIADGNPIPLVRGVGPMTRTVQTVIPAQASGGCSCGAPSGVCTCTENQSAHSGFVYAIGTVEAEYPNVAIEREMQILAHAVLDPTWVSTADVPMRLTEDRSWQHAVLTARPEMTRYIARQLSWRLTIEDLPAFVLKPQDPRDFAVLIDCLGRPKYPSSNGGNGKKTARKGKASEKREENGSTSLDPLSRYPQDLDVVVGVRGAQTPDGIEVLVDQIFTIPPERLSRGMGIFAQLSDNFGLTDAERAYNFLVARYTIPPAGLADIETVGLAGVPVISSRLSGSTGRVVRVVLTLPDTNGSTGKKYFVRVDVTHEFPMILTPWQQYLDRGEAL